jgi:SAM-dependent methyltransferase
MGNMSDAALWLDSPLGRAVIDLERELLRAALADVFGFELLQIGAWGRGGELSASARTQNRRWIAPQASGPGAVRASYDALPVASGSVEAVLLPHTLEYAPNPHELLREVDRVLRGEGQVLVCGFSPLGPWGLRHRLSHGRFPPPAQRLLGEGRLRDWLTLLGFELAGTRRYLFAPPWQRRRRGDGAGWLERRGPMMAPPLAGAYLVRACKRVRCVTPIRPTWSRPRTVVGGIAEPTPRNAA